MNKECFNFLAGDKDYIYVNKKKCVEGCRCNLLFPNKDIDLYEGFNIHKTHIDMYHFRDGFSNLIGRVFLPQNLIKVINEKYNVNEAYDVLIKTPEFKIQYDTSFL